jgi:hypothetical protein
MRFKRRNLERSPAASMSAQKRETAANVVPETDPPSDCTAERHALASGWPLAVGRRRRGFIAIGERL